MISLKYFTIELITLLQTRNLYHSFELLIIPANDVINPHDFTFYQRQ